MSKQNPGKTLEARLSWAKTKLKEAVYAANKDIIAKREKELAAIEAEIADAESLAKATAAALDALEPEEIVDAETLAKATTEALDVFDEALEEEIGEDLLDPPKGIDTIHGDIPEIAPVEPEGSTEPEETETSEEPEEPSTDDAS